MKSTIKRLYNRSQQSLWRSRIRRADKRGRFFTPHRVQIETTNACNMKCTHCPHRIQRRPVGVMGDSLFRKIINDCKENRVSSIALHNFGEPLLDRRIFDRIRMAKDLGIERVEIYSNAALLDEARARKLIDSGLDVIYISLDGLSPEEYQRIRPGFSYEDISANIKGLFALRNKLGAVTPEIRVATSTEGPFAESEKQRFVNQWKGIAAEVGVVEQMVWPSEDGAEAIEGEALFPCSLLWDQMYVLQNGDVVLCCLDYEGKVVLGNLRESTIAEVYRGSLLRRVRDAHLEGRFSEIFSCQNCRYVRSAVGWSRVVL